jgi:3-deoxy-D-manno-octulosonate 8-phosphate phosphatase (KDO 8-P phosphatase)
MQEVGVSAAPADAADDILGIAAWVTQKPGGKGAVREIIETVMKVQGNWLSKEGFVW